MTRDTKSVEITPDSSSGISSVPKSYRARLTDVEKLTKAILAVAMISLVGIVVAVCALVLDQMHFNNQTYKNQTQLTNTELLKLNQQIELLNTQVENQSVPKTPSE